MKKKFITPEIEFFKLSSEDILCSSPNDREDVINKDSTGIDGTGGLEFSDIG